MISTVEVRRVARSDTQNIRGQIAQGSIRFQKLQSQCRPIQIRPGNIANETEGGDIGMAEGAIGNVVI